MDDPVSKTSRTIYQNPTGSLDPLELEKPAESAGAHIFALDPLPIDNREAFDLLFFNLRSHWKLPFALMVVMSGCIAALGLSENSAAVIIGAMIVAPLSQPILALGAAISLGWKEEIARLSLLVLAGAASVVTIAYLINIALPNTTPNEQILARTAPDLRDLGIALAAGIAGAYGYYRSEFSTVLSRRGDRRRPGSAALCCGNDDGRWQAVARPGRDIAVRNEPGWHPGCITAGLFHWRHLCRKRTKEMVSWRYRGNGHDDCFADCSAGRELCGDDRSGQCADRQISDNCKHA